MGILFTTVSSFTRALAGIVAVGTLCVSGSSTTASAATASAPSALAATTPQRNTLKLETLGANISGEDFVRAIATQHAPLIDLFLGAPIDVNARDEHQCTPLLAACGSADWRLAARLLNKGADAKLADDRGRTPLMMAALHGNVEMFRTLISHGADPIVADAQGHTALHYAVAARQKEVALQALDTVPNPAAPCCQNATLLTHALHSNDWQLIEPLLTRCAGDLHWTSETRALLASAINKFEADRVRLLLSKHATPPTPEGSEQPLLAWAVARNDLNLCRFLLDCGADPNATLNTPAEKEFLDIIPGTVVRHYLEDEPGMNTLMLAAGLARPEFVKLLVEKGANRTTPTRSKHKLIPVYFAAWAQSPESIQLLLGNAPSPDKLRIEISLSAQRASLIKNGVPVLHTEISSGRPGFSTPQGRFVVTDKQQSHMSTIYKVKMPFFMRLSCRDFGMHEGYVPDYPASHGCIRLPAEMARRLFREVPVGTLVTIAY
jgi:ankyrin repeat protein